MPDKTYTKLLEELKSDAAPNPGFRYIISYDLKGVNRDYRPIEEILERWKGTRLLESVWFVNSTSDATTLRNELLVVMKNENSSDDNDRLLVVEIGNNDWFNLKCGEAKAEALLKRI